MGGIHFSIHLFPCQLQLPPSHRYIDFDVLFHAALLQTHFSMKAMLCLRGISSPQAQYPSRRGHVCDCARMSVLWMQGCTGFHHRASRKEHACLHAVDMSLHCVITFIKIEPHATKGRTAVMVQLGQQPTHEATTQQRDSQIQGTHSQ